MGPDARYQRKAFVSRDLSSALAFAQDGQALDLVRGWQRGALGVYQFVYQFERNREQLRATKEASVYRHLEPGRPRSIELITRRSRVRIPPPLLQKAWKSTPPRDRRSWRLRAQIRLMSFDSAVWHGPPVPAGGAKTLWFAPHSYMAERIHPPGSNDALDELVSQLLSRGAVLSQMAQWDAAGLAASDAAPIPMVAHMLIRGVLADARHRHSRPDLETAAAIVKEATEAICENVFLVPLDEAESSGTDCHAGDAGK
jgi:hypothetical protein